MEQTFASASEAAERWCTLLADIASYAETGNVPAAYGLAYKLSADLSKNRAQIVGAKEALVSASEGLIKHNGVLGVESYPSAHEAIADIAALAVLGLLGPLEGITDETAWLEAAGQLLAERWEELTLTSSEASNLRARVRRERVKLTPSTYAIAPDDAFLPAESPASWAKRFNRDVSTLKRWVKDGKLRCKKINSKLWQLHRGDARTLGCDMQ